MQNIRTPSLCIGKGNEVKIRDIGVLINTPMHNTTPSALRVRPETEPGAAAGADGERGKFSLYLRSNRRAMLSIASPRAVG